MSLCGCEYVRVPARACVCVYHTMGRGMWMRWEKRNKKKEGGETGTGVMRIKVAQGKDRAYFL
jgi:hypothetical protein